MFATGTDTWKFVGDTSFVGQAALEPWRKLWDDVLGGSTDDAQVSTMQYHTTCGTDSLLLQWVIMTYWKIADWKKAHKEAYEPFLVKLSFFPTS